MSRGEIHTTQHVRTNNRIAYEIVNFHDGAPVGVFNQKSEFLSNCKVKRIELQVVVQFEFKLHHYQASACIREGWQDTIRKASADDTRLVPKNSPRKCPD